METEEKMIKIYVIELMRANKENISKEIEKILNENLFAVKKVTGINQKGETIL